MGLGHGETFGSHMVPGRHPATKCNKDLLMETEYHKGTILCTKDTVAPGSGGSRRKVSVARCGIQHIRCGVQRGCIVQTVIKNRC